MMRTTVRAAKVAVAAVVLGLAGCGEAGPGEGMPKDMTKPAANDPVMQLKTMKPGVAPGADAAKPGETPAQKK